MVWGLDNKRLLCVVGFGTACALGPDGGTPTVVWGPDVGVSRTVWGPVGGTPRVVWRPDGGPLRVVWGPGSSGAWGPWWFLEGSTVFVARNGSLVVVSKSASRIPSEGDFLMAMASLSEVGCFGEGAVLVWLLSKDGSCLRRSLSGVSCCRENFT